MADQVQPRTAAPQQHCSSAADQLFLARKRHAECLAAREELRGLLARAERRRATEPTQRQKWEQVISDLEGSYAELRLRLEQHETTIRMCERGLATDTAETPAVATAAQDSEVPTAEPEVAAIGSDSIAALQRILDMPFEQLRQLNLEQLGRLCATLEAHPAHQRDARRVRARLEFANQMNGSGQRIVLNEEGQEQRRQLMLRGAIDKIHANRIDDLERSEIHLLIQCRRQLSARINPSNRDIRLLGLLSDAVTRLIEAGKA
ncbi:MAG: hypothetical protein IT368_15080 [Candidatus Hydrogenedentes bacterium]|nr:hypothetical protein [Candidatus Hydrogenedentota bacterium]